MTLPTRLPALLAALLPTFAGLAHAADGLLELKRPHRSPRR